MKIGILTFHAAHNYGAVLQAYGLQEFLKSRGHAVEVVDYRPDYLTRPYQVIPRWRVNKKHGVFANALRLGYYCARILTAAILRAPMRVRRARGFENFISGALNLSRERFKEGGRVPAENYDALVFGSDQIWSPNHTDGGDPVFLGDFPVPSGTLKIAYAASAGAASATLGENPIFANALKNFDALSVREENLAESLRPRTEKEIETVLDPTLLAERDVWEKLARTPRAMPKKYVLVYQVMFNPEADRIAAELAAQIGAEVVSVWAGYASRGNMRKTETPAEFVGWFKNAACVVSTSFHGTAFSLIFEKPFYYVGKGEAAENRPRQILGALGLMSRYVSPSAHPVFSEIDYGSVNAKNKWGGGMDSRGEALSAAERLLALRERSSAFLARALALRKTA